jgi:hypothetical protein
VNLISVVLHKFSFRAPVIDVERRQVLQEVLQLVPKGI